MATKQNSKQSSNARKKRSSTVKQKAEIKQNGLLQDEIILVITFFVSVLLFLSNFSLCGKVGHAVSGFVFGMIGVVAYILPLAIFFGTAFHISNSGNRTAGRKILSAVVFLVTLTALIQLINTPYDQMTKIYEYYTVSMTYRSGGGIIGGIQVMIFCGLFEPIATYIILIAIMIITMIVISGKALFTYFAKKSSASFEQRKVYQKLRKEQQAEEAYVGVQETINLRRPAKTFIVNQNNKVDTVKAPELKIPISKKSKHENKSEYDSIQDLPLVNMGHIFDMEEVTPTDPSLSVGANEQPFSNNSSTCEEELKNKFGGADKEIMIKNPAPYPITGANRTEVTSVEEKEVHEKKDVKDTSHSSTNVEHLDIQQKVEEKRYIFPPIDLLTKPKAAVKGMTDKSLQETALKLQQTLESFGVHVTVTNISCGPAVTRYELQPEQGVKVSKITSLADDIKLNLAASDIRIEAPIPGKAAVGIEVPNNTNSMVLLRELIESKEFTSHPSDIAFAVGKDIGGQTVVTDIAKMPHLLIAGATGSGKSVCINTLIMSIIYKANPADVRLIMVDPKVVELSVYNGIPHLLIPVVTDPKKASAALNWAVIEMTERYKKFADVGVRDLKGYNEKVAEIADLKDEKYQKLPQIVIIVDELADLMMVAPGEVEDSICRLAQMARAAGLHLIIATQRPSVNVITGLIKANIPSRIAFSVSSAIDSRTIIDGSGAEKLLGKGDMLFFPSGYPKPIRVQGAFVSDKEVSAAVEFLKKHNTEAQYSDDVSDKITNAKSADSLTSGSNGNDRDDYFIEAGKFIIEKDKASIGMLQRVYKIGFNRAARIMDQLAESGVVGPEEGTKPRKVLMSPEEFDQYVDEY